MAILAGLLDPTEPLAGQPSLAEGDTHLDLVLAGGDQDHRDLAMDEPESSFAWWRIGVNLETAGLIGFESDLHAADAGVTAPELLPADLFF